MKISHECGPCFLRQAGEALDLATDNSELKIEIFNEIFNFLAGNFSTNTNSNKTGSTIHKIIKERTGCKDPYKKEKVLGNKIALKYLPQVKTIIEEEDSLENYVKIAIIGNILDFGAFTLNTDIDELINNALQKQLKINHVESLEQSAKKHDKLLYLVDNTGEIVFDKLLLEKLKSYGLDITIAVKSEPILNDACMEDALAVGLDKYGDIVEIGAGTVGYVDSEISDDFRKIFNDHKFIISKGMGNYEGLTEIDTSDKELYFLLCSKCHAISKDMGVDLQDMVLLKNH
ncbi:MAG: ARMT1-like domain-containing protein [Methanobrevibacter sp.]|uniref:damage-control phosphatase ARMT1 family protein n=1 Tax=Methanobrevibacter sp. TaxID=66852 RepID=UPI0026DFC0B0|nr:ARMT1-like domain-containing protein [Methanobrevibacter sp.]MDO5848382.1 ARMT1-like domain-containing protein [Methanobrevibacter sp.]